MEQCTKLITTTYDDIVRIVSQRKKSLLTQLNKIANEKLKNIESANERMKENAVNTSSVEFDCFYIDYNIIYL